MSFLVSDLTGESFGLSHYTLAHHENLVSSHYKTQILGGQSNVRDIWWKDSSVLVTDLQGHLVTRPQEDMLVLLAAGGFRDDDHGGAPSVATPLTQFDQTGNLVTLGAGGVISMNTSSFPSSCAPWGDPSHPMCDYRHRAEREPMLKDDQDFFRFKTITAGTFELEVRTINNRLSDRTKANLDVELEVWRLSNGTWRPLSPNLVRTLHGNFDLFARVRVTETSGNGGEYAVAVKSAGEYGDLGQYTVLAKGEIVHESIQSLRFDEPSESRTLYTSMDFSAPDQRWYRVETKHGGTLSIEPRLAPRSSDAGFDLAVLDTGFQVRSCCNREAGVCLSDSSPNRHT